MSEIITFEQTPEHFCVFWKYIKEPNVTDIDYNGSSLWITDLIKGRYEAEEKITAQFLNSFTRNVCKYWNFSYCSLSS